ncbi:putative acetyl esterase [Rosellinia necatrix]|uniref:Putative acetyl esterase n=1 Tax=Rosellinia necatrix TaxID=77044 RepID=A0A1W2TIL9_ROSNE|nr:putative acetyl esterase [Rosellinia necatrix]
MLFQALLLGSFAIGIDGYACCGVENLIVFGDSYTDEGRLGYFFSSGGAPPPPGTVIPTGNVTASGGNSWPYYASEELGAAIYNYAISGAVCSNEIVYRHLDAINGPFPSVIDYQVPAFQADVEYAENTTNTTFLQNRTAENSVYALWIGTNDLGNGGFLLDKQVPGNTISDYIDCIWSAFDGIYSTGARRFAIFTQAPLEVSPLYAAPENGGTGNVNFWTNKTAYNTAEYESKILEYTTTVNTIYSYGVPFELLVRKRWPGASFIIMDTHQIILDIHNEPETYLTAPADVLGYYYTCPDPLSSDGCAPSEYPLSSFLWYDALHPSSRADQIIGEEFARALQGNSSYATYYS